jgi:hypothetical protein
MPTNLSIRGKVLITSGLIRYGNIVMCKQVLNKKPALQYNYKNTKIQGKSQQLFDEVSKKGF